MQGRRLEEDSSLQAVGTGQPGWGLGFRPVCGLTGPNNQVGPYLKPEYAYGYSYLRVEVSNLK
jgi:hypothetical protein